MNNRLTLYHGSTQVIATPALAKGKPHNDYGRGFYCTQSLELAKEWACSTETDGFANCYDFDIEHLSVLYLSNGQYHILNWLSILLENRTFRIGGDIAQRAHEYISQQSGVALRMIQLYEQRQNDINKAQVGTLLSLAKALGCEMEHLME